MIQCERESKRRIIDDFKYVGLHRGANSNAIYRDGDLLGKREGRVQICDYHFIR